MIWSQNDIRMSCIDFTTRVGVSEEEEGWRVVVVICNIIQLKPSWVASLYYQDVYIPGKNKTLFLFKNRWTSRDVWNLYAGYYGTFFKFYKF